MSALNGDYRDDVRPGGPAEGIYGREPGASPWETKREHHRSPIGAIESARFNDP